MYHVKNQRYYDEKEKICIFKLPLYKYHPYYSERNIFGFIS